MQKQRGVLRASRLQNVVVPDQKNVNTTAVLPASNQNELLTTPTMLSTVTDTHNQNGSENDQQKVEDDLLVDRNKLSLNVSSSQMTSRNASVGIGFKKEQFYSVGDAHLTSQSKTPFFPMLLIFRCRLVPVFSFQLTLQVIM
jgi:hypothetical protein